MKPTTSPYTNSVFKLPGGTEENDLPAERTTDEAGRRLIISTWQPDDAERAAIMAGSPIELIVWGDAQPPVAVAVADAIPPSTADGRHRRADAGRRPTRRRVPPCAGRPLPRRDGLDET